MVFAHRGHFRRFGCLMAVSLRGDDCRPRTGAPRDAARSLARLHCPGRRFRLALVALTVGLLARERLDPNEGYFQLFFSDTLHLKAWFATAAVALAVLQLFTAAWIFRKLPWRRPAWIPAFHRWTGRLTFALTLPVAYHCIFKLGYQHTTSRVLAHSLLGCAVYGGSPRRSSSCACTVSQSGCSPRPAESSSAFSSPSGTRVQSALPARRRRDLDGIEKRVAAAEGQGRSARDRP